MANGERTRTLGKQGTLQSMGLDLDSKRRKSRSSSPEEQVEMQSERRMDLRQRAEVQGRLGMEANNVNLKRKNVKKNGNRGDLNNGRL